LGQFQRNVSSIPATSAFPSMSTLPTEFSNVTVTTKANVYFDGKVVSHTVLLADGAKKTLGLIYPGAYHFNTDVPGKSGFGIEVKHGICEYICSFL
jgi:uncharacterized protein YaiE (UPF0345 family)